MECPTPSAFLSSRASQNACGAPRTPFVPPPEPAPESERYTVVVNNVPVRELLFALARDAEVNVDIHPNIAGEVTLNAIDQTLTQILDRIARQIDMRYEVSGDSVMISADEPYFRTYEVGYVNLSRDVDTTVNVAVKVATTGGRLSGSRTCNLMNWRSSRWMENRRCWSAARRST